MKTKALLVIVFALSIVCLIITMTQFVSMGVYVDENGTSPSVVLGGQFWLYMAWIKLGLLGVLTLVSGLAALLRRD